MLSVTGFIFFRQSVRCLSTLSRTPCGPVEFNSKVKSLTCLYGKVENLTCYRFKSQESKAQLFQLKAATLVRSPKKKSSPSLNNKNLLMVEAFSTAEEYRFSDLYDVLSKKTDLVEVKISDDLADDVISFKLNKGNDVAKPSTMYIFRDGATVFWNFDPTEIKNTLQLLRAFEIKSYPDDLVHEENEQMQFAYTDVKSKISRNTIQLIDNEDPPLCQYTFSNALALSVKLSIWESSLDYYVDSIKFISSDIRDGKKIKLTQDEVFRKTGELFSLRHQINLSSDLLDTPDFYWDRQELENLFIQTCSYLNTLKRTKVMNDKLNHCLELMNLLESHLSDKHHVRLEWMVIILIMCEVVFEIIHYYERLVEEEEHK
ncbi:required for meiotic nuclear division protein 1 homolog [Panonychus citri]|uniref:required for meiotic nuclear division protein 1 homolog n=1 Tax=Panonychus citri TaxID=50023 RepID=UPI00230820C9|nr:required for meiotic nuclear division protein 1 homolog [Panonychus citri]